MEEQPTTPADAAAQASSQVSSASSSPTASRRSIMLYYQEVSLRVRAAIGGATLARAARLPCGPAASARAARWAGLWQGGQCGMRRSWGTKRASMMQGDMEVQAGPSGIATPACGARGGRPLFAAFARLCTPR